MTWSVKSHQEGLGHADKQAGSTESTQLFMPLSTTPPPILFSQRRHYIRLLKVRVRGTATHPHSSLGCLTHIQTADMASQMEQPASSQVVVFFLYFHINHVCLDSVLFSMSVSSLVAKFLPKFDTLGFLFSFSIPDHKRLKLLH